MSKIEPTSARSTGMQSRPDLASDVATPNRSHAGTSVSKALYEEVAGLESLKTQMDRILRDMRVPSRRGLVRNALDAERGDRFLPPPPLPEGRTRSWNATELHAANRELLTRHPAGGEGPRGELVRTLEVLFRARESLLQRMATKG